MEYWDTESVLFGGTYTDLYQVAMGQALFRDGQHQQSAVFDYFFRRLPFDGGYVVFAGLEPLLEALENWHFSGAEIDYLATLGFAPDYLDYLRNLRFTGAVLHHRKAKSCFRQRLWCVLKAQLCRRNWSKPCC